MGLPHVSTGATRTALVSFAAAFGALVALAVAGAGAAAPTAAQANSVTFQDSTGEDAQGPDITTVVVANDNQGKLTFTLNIPNRPTFTGDMSVGMFLDTDANSATGDPNFGGADYLIELDGPLTGQAGIFLLRWNGTDYSGSGVAQTSLVFSYANGAATITINAAELGATKKFGFLALAITGVVLGPDGEPDFTNVRFDAAPDVGHGLYSYEVKTTPPSLGIRSSGSSPARARAGKRYTVFAVVTRTDTGAVVTSGRVTCRASVGGRAVRGSGAFSAGRARCSFSIPASAKGKRLRGTMTVVSGGLSISRNFSAPVA